MNLRNTDGRTYAQPISSSPSAIRTMLEFAEIKPGDTVLDIGSCEGDVLYEVCLLGAKGVGIEYDPGLVKKSRQRLSGMSAKIIYGDIRDNRHWHHKGYNHRDAVGNSDVVMMYLSNGMNEFLRPLLEKELREGIRVVSNFFPIKGWRYIKFEPKNHIYLYNTPESFELYAPSGI